MKGRNIILLCYACPFLSKLLLKRHKDMIIMYTLQLFSICFIHVWQLFIKGHGGSSLSGKGTHTDKQTGQGSLQYFSVANSVCFYEAFFFSKNKSSEMSALIFFLFRVQSLFFTFIQDERTSSLFGVTFSFICHTFSFKKSPPLFQNVFDFSKKEPICDIPLVDILASPSPASPLVPLQHIVIYSCSSPCPPVWVVLELDPNSLSASSSSSAYSPLPPPVSRPQGDPAVFSSNDLS